MMLYILIWVIYGNSFNVHFMYEISNRLVGRSLRKLRCDAGLTQVAVAQRLKTPQSFVSKVEIGERGLKLGEVYSYAEALGIDVFKLVEAVRGQANH